MNFLFIFTIGLIPACILGKQCTESQLPFCLLDVNFYSLPSTNEDIPKNSDINNTLSSNDTVDDIEESRSFTVPEDPQHCPSEPDIPCDPSDPYRTINGTCNNLNHPEWGMYHGCYVRYQPATYEGFEGFRKSKNGGPLPKVRDLTLNIFKDVHRPSSNISFMFVVYGQNLAHDLSRAENYNTQQLCCPNPSVHELCIPIYLSSEDPFYSPYNVTCLERHRTESCGICKTKNREQLNAVTASLDASMIYGTEDQRAIDIRCNDGTGKLLVNSTEHGELLPADKGPYLTFCRNKKIYTCFLAGDIRVNQHVFLTGISTYCVREHNRIATTLKKLNPHWEEEKLYQEAKKINTAELQCITYKEFLPALLGPYIMDQMNLTLKDGSESTIYNPNVRLGTSNEFSTAAFRLHSMIPKEVGVEDGRFKDYYGNPEIVSAGQMERIMKGVYSSPSEQYDRYSIEDVTNYMAQRSGLPYGNDLSSLDITRGRDHGLATYKNMAEFCSGGRLNITTFDDLAPLMTKSNRQTLKENYDAVDDIDLWVGMQMENYAPGAAMGPTAACIISIQFYVVKFGDRFFFEHEGEVPSFTAAQRNSLKTCSLSRIICDNSDMTRVQKNVMLLPSTKNPEVSCQDIPEIDLSPWKETPSVETSTYKNY